MRMVKMESGTPRKVPDVIWKEGSNETLGGIPAPAKCMPFTSANREWALYDISYRHNTQKAYEESSGAGPDDISHILCKTIMARMMYERESAAYDCATVRPRFPYAFLNMY